MGQGGHSRSKVFQPAPSIPNSSHDARWSQWLQPLSLHHVTQEEEREQGKQVTYHFCLHATGQNESLHHIYGVCFYKRRSGHKPAQRGNYMQAQGKHGVCKPRNQASEELAFGTWILHFSLRD